ncbi:MAG TPA: zf-HC2 domain-containing protein, partial [Bryobacteraceae bacterium]
MTCGQARGLLGAYLDGELDVVHAMEIEGHAHECSACTSLLETHKQLSAAILTAPYYPAPSWLRARLEHSAAPVWRRPAAWLAVAASLIVALAVTMRLAPTDRLSTEIVQAHLRSIRAGHLVDVPSSGGHPVRPWFAGKLDYALDVENISGRGFEPAGARLDSLNGRTVAVLVYRRDSHVVNVFVWPSEELSDRPPGGRSANGLHIVNWRAEGMNWWAVSDLSLGELEQLPL